MRAYYYRWNVIEVWIESLMWCDIFTNKSTELIIVIVDYKFRLLTNHSNKQMLKQSNFCYHFYKSITVNKAENRYGQLHIHVGNVRNHISFVEHLEYVNSLKMICIWCNMSGPWTGRGYNYLNLGWKGPEFNLVLPVTKETYAISYQAADSSRD